MFKLVIIGYIALDKKTLIIPPITYQPPLKIQSGKETKNGQSHTSNPSVSLNTKEEASTMPKCT